MLKERSTEERPKSSFIFFRDLQTKEGLLFQILCVRIPAKRKLCREEKNKYARVHSSEMIAVLWIKIQTQSFLSIKSKWKYYETKKR